jgi:LysR family glycine cleavage system transcriptional activator
MVYRFLPLNGLRAFEAAARHRSFKKAAEELFVTPTAVSHQIKTLEDSLGVQLFHRLTRALALTAEGEAILPKVSEGLECLAAAVEQTRDPRKAGALSVVAPPAFAARWLVPRLRGFSAAHPEVQLHLSSSFKTIDGAERGSFPLDVDTHDGATGIAICFGFGHYPGCRVDLIFAADYFPVCSPSLLKAKRPLRSPQDLRWHVLIQDDTIPDEANRPTWEGWFKAAGVKGVDPHQGPRFRDVSLALEAARDGQGVALTMEPLARADIVAGRLVIPFETSLRARFAFYLVVPAPLAERPTVTAFRQWLLEEASKEPHRSASGRPAEK